MAASFAATRSFTWAMFQKLVAYQLKVHLHFGARRLLAAA
jgi:hypothetical protein